MGKVKISTSLMRFFTAQLDLSLVENWRLSAPLEFLFVRSPFFSGRAVELTAASLSSQRGSVTIGANQGFVPVLMMFTFSYIKVFV